MLLAFSKVEDAMLRDQIEEYNRQRNREYERHVRSEQSRHTDAEAEVVQALLDISAPSTRV